MIWPLYTALLALLFCALSVRTLRLRGRFKVAVGDGGNGTLLRAIRVHANFAEYVPIGLLLIAGCEVLDAPAWLIHGLGSTLLVGRLVHAYGLANTAEVMAFRVTGMVFTFSSLLTSAGFILWGALSASA